MDRYSYEESKRIALERCPVPFGIYQFIDERVVTVLLSDGFVDMIGMSREDATVLMDTDMYRGTHADDVGRISEQAYEFVSGDGLYDALYRTWSLRTNNYVVMHSHGKHIYEDGVKLSIIWYSVLDVSNNSYIIGENGISGGAVSSILSRDSLIYDSKYDGLTGLPNMTYFLSLAEAGKKKAKKLSRPFTMMFFDLSGMRAFNESNGLEEGDKLLRAVASILKSHFSNENCSRLAEDHFAVYTDKDNLKQEIDAIFDEVSTCNNGITLPVRVGLYLDEFEDVDMSTACDRAKVACDQGKQAYISKYYFYNSQLHERSARRNYILNNFEKAMDEGWISPYYQMIVDPRESRICDMEVLSRWVDPEKGFMAPDEFISILENARLIHKHDLYILDRAIEDIKTRRSIGMPDVPISINLSRYDFQMCDMVEEICWRLDKAGMEHSMITIEVTESVADINIEFLKTQIKRFHDAGFKVWMDDFGSGYSSLNVLQEFDFDLIKFDMKFLRNLNQSPKNIVIITELMQMVNKLGISTVTEGVETIEQIDFLKEIGCDMLQGYYYNKPCTNETVLERYKMKGNPINII